MNRSSMIEILDSSDKAIALDIFERAYAAKIKHVGKKVYYRGIIELSNICTKDCFYCGVRKSNHGIERFSMSFDEILEAAQFANEKGYGSIVLQSGERTDKDFIDHIETLIREIKKITKGKLGITLSLGEQKRSTFRRWFDAGAHRYLLRIETSNHDLYARLHPKDHSFKIRRNCLVNLRKTGYQVGTGVMIGLPGQSSEDLADDIIFFKDIDIDMIGMGPYISHESTPLLDMNEAGLQRNYMLGLKMIALTRLYLKDVNIAATTALQALDPEGREEGLKAGANIIMPNITPVKYRDSYTLYNGKPCLDENKEQCCSCLEGRIRSTGEERGYNEWGDSPHFFKRKQRMISQ